MRLHAHRALRLFVAAGAWAAGLCLVIASVALVVEAAGPPRASSVEAMAGLSPPRSISHVLRTFSGIGDRTTPSFTVARHSWWRLRYLYQCRPGIPGQRLIVREGDAAGGGISVNATSASGGGSVAAYATGRTHYLVVITNCAWRAWVLGRG